MKKQPFISILRIGFFLTALLPAMFLQAQRGLPLPAYDQRSPVVFWRKPGVTSQAAIQYLKDKGYITEADAKVVSYCRSCDSTIFAIPSLAFVIDGQQETVKAKENPLGGPSGELGPLYYSINYLFTTPESRNGSAVSPTSDPLRLASLKKDKPGVNPVLTGVLDTGADTAVAKSFAGNGFKSCMAGGEYGWNFADNTPSIADNLMNDKGELVRHGTPVTNLLIEQAAKIPLQVLAVKVLNQRGQCNLFQVMCALAYAQQAGVKIINASLGFYASRRQVQGFENYVRTITQNGVIIVAAAGNANEEEDKKAAAASGLKDQFNNRDLDQHPFFPAAFSESNQHIISVTTLSYENSKIKTVSPNQNFSPTKVQVGVYADLENFAFIEPFTIGTNPGTRIGSSFATPIVAGQIAAKFYEIFPAGSISKTYNRDLMLAKVFGPAVPPVLPGVAKLPLYRTAHKQINTTK